MATQQRPHPSERFQRGEVRDFLAACENDRYQAYHEYSLFPEHNTDADSAAMDAYLVRIATAEQLYRELVLPVVKQAESRCADALRAADLAHYARALELGSYTELAI